MTYYNCAKFRARSVFSFGVSRVKVTPLGTNVSECNQEEVSRFCDVDRPKRNERTSVTKNANAC